MRGSLAIDGRQPSNGAFKSEELIYAVLLAAALSAAGLGAQEFSKNPGLGSPYCDGVLSADLVVPPSILIVGTAYPTSASPLEHCNNIESRDSFQQHTGDVLTTKWLTAPQLAALVQTQGICYRKGRFSPEENRQVRMAIQSYQHVGHFDSIHDWEVLFIP